FGANGGKGAGRFDQGFRAGLVISREVADGGGVVAESFIKIAFLSSNTAQAVVGKSEDDRFIGAHDATAGGFALIALGHLVKTVGFRKVVGAGTANVTGFEAAAGALKLGAGREHRL